MHTLAEQTQHYFSLAIDGVLLSSYTLGLAFVVLVLASELGVFF